MVNWVPQCQATTLYLVCFDHQSALDVASDNLSPKASMHCVCTWLVRAGTCTCACMCRNACWSMHCWLALCNVLDHVLSCATEAFSGSTVMLDTKCMCAGESQAQIITAARNKAASLSRGQSHTQLKHASLLALASCCRLVHHVCQVALAASAHHPLSHHTWFHDNARSKHGCAQTSMQHPANAGSMPCHLHPACCTLHAAHSMQDYDASNFTPGPRQRTSRRG